MKFLRNNQVDQMSEWRSCPSASRLRSMFGKFLVQSELF
jgi:hypothetical protein